MNSQVCSIVHLTRTTFGIGTTEGSLIIRDQDNMILNGHEGPVTSLCRHTPGKLTRMLLSASSECIRIWDLNDLCCIRVIRTEVMKVYWNFNGDIVNLQARVLKYILNCNISLFIKLF
jgi:WD40 repeat protein